MIKTSTTNFINQPQPLPPSAITTPTTTTTTTSPHQGEKKKKKPNQATRNGSMARGRQRGSTAWFDGVGQGHGPVTLSFGWAGGSETER